MSESLTGRDITMRFNILGKLMELHNLDPDIAKRYQSAAYNLEKSGIDVATASPTDLKGIPGVNKLILSKIEELKKHGELQELENLTKITPPGLFELLNLKGLGPKKISALWRELNIESLTDLEKACLDNRVAKLKGFGTKTQENIVAQLNFVRSSDNQHRFATVEDDLRRWNEWLKTVLPASSFLLTGEVLRLDPVISMLEYVIDENVLNTLVSKTPLKFVQTQVNEQTLEFFNGMLRVRLYGVDPKYLTWHQFNFSLTDGHRKLLTDAGWTGKAEPIESDSDIYTGLGLPYIIPEMREGLFEFEWSKKYDPQELVDFDLLAPKEQRCFRGMIHMHTKYSDGYHTIQEMAEECIAMGAEYMVLSDHSQAAYYAGGLKPDRLIEQHKEVDDLNSKYAGRFRIFKSIECDILSDGSLDYNREILSSFDLVIASIHAGQKMDEETATNRLLRAIKNPFTSILGHPTGRQLLIRPGYPVNMEVILDACKEHDVVIEINANPRRLDMDWKYIWPAMEKGLTIAINPDAHTFSDLHDIRFGVNVARKGGLVKERLLNAMSLSQFESFVSNQQAKRL